jgi:hypothetical protein
VSPALTAFGNGVPGRYVRSWRYAGPNIPNARVLVAVVVLIIVNLAIFGARKEVRGTLRPNVRPASCS